MDERHLGALRIEVRVNGEQLGLVGRDELEELGQELLQGFELALLDRVGSAHEKWCRHHDSFPSDDFAMGLRVRCWYPQCFAFTCVLPGTALADSEYGGPERD
jgi:hypothetical protein